MAALLSATTFRTQYLPGVSAADSDSVTRITAILARAEERVVAFLGYPLQSGATVAAWSTGAYVLRLGFRTPVRTRLALPVHPVTAIASVYQDTDKAFGATTLIASGDYEQENLPNGAYLHLLPTGSTGAWYTGDREIKVSCTAGYANEAAIPLVLADAVYRLAQHRYQRAQTGHLDSTSKNGQSESFSEDEDIPARIQNTLSSYRMIGMVGV